MQTFRFSFNTKYASELRRAVNDRHKQSIDNKHRDKQVGGDEYLAWDRTCTIMDRLEDTLSYLNTIELGKCVDHRSAFDFYDFINNAYIVIECIKTMGSIFRMGQIHIDNIEKSFLVFDEKDSDGRYFEYIRSLCSVHPLCTNHQKGMLQGSRFHCCPFVTWKGSMIPTLNEDCDLEAWIYMSKEDNNRLILPLHISKFEQYLNKWIDIIPKVIEAKNNYTDNKYEELKATPVKDLTDFDNNVIEYLLYLRKECSDRFDYYSGEFDEYIRVFSIRLSDKRNKALLQKYKNAIIYSLEFVKNGLQNMSYKGWENSGIRYPNKSIETTLFLLLDEIDYYDGSFSEYVYELGNLHCLEPNAHYLDKQFTRRLLERSKGFINQYVHFTNAEPDEESIVLVKLALYFESLTRKCLLNKNIPNFKKYRLEKLSRQDYSQLISEEAPSEDQEGVMNILCDFIKNGYGV